jgi:glycosyltransferase involved in cell wall biosynthesis
MPAFTVVICTYNRCGTLAGALASVLAQEADFEVVVVDDGSTDDTAAVVAGYDSPRIRYVWRANGGLSAARNTGIREARGDFVIFLDDDDRADPTWLSSLAGAMDASTGAVSCGCWYESPDGAEQAIRLPSKLPLAFDGVTALFLAGTFAVRRELYEHVGGYAEDLAISHQTELALRLLPELAHRGLTVTAVRRPLVHIERRAAADRIWRPEDNLRGTEYILGRHGDRLARSPAVVANYHGVAGVAAFQIGERARGRDHFRSAFRADPRSPRHAARLVLAYVSPLAERFWCRHGTPASAGAAAPPSAMSSVSAETLPS